VYKNHVRRTARPDLACYAALGEIESPKVGYAKDWKIAKLQFNEVELGEYSFPRKRKKGRKGCAIARNVAGKVTS
jgi:hypothetical protein